MSQSIGEFFAMGGYAAYVWSAFGITAAVMLANVVMARRAHRRMVTRLRRRAIARGGE
jgi:heme exporter protein D